MKRVVMSKKELDFCSEEELVRSEGEGLRPEYYQIRNYTYKCIDRFRICIFSKSTCPFCDIAKKKFKEHGLKYFAYELDKNPDLEPIFRQILRDRTGMTSFPNIFVNSFHVGGCEECLRCFQIGRMYDLLEGNNQDFDFDIIVIGAGSGGISAAKEARKLGKSVAIFDYVKRTPRGCRWGVGGTSVNVGCIPKKLFHYAAIMSNVFDDAPKYGWKIEQFKRGPDAHNWKILVDNIQMYIKSLNIAYLKFFANVGIYYQNKYAIFLDKHTVEAYDDKQRRSQYTAQNFILAVGSKPYIPDIPGSEHGISTDDLFFLKTNPKKVLVVGASYIALEISGFLHGLGVEVTLAVRSQLMRGFDQDMAEKIGQNLSYLGVRILRRYILEEIKKSDLDDIPVYEFTAFLRKASSPDEKNPSEPVEYKVYPDKIIEEFAIIVFATGRIAKCKDMRLERIGVRMHEVTHKVIADSWDRTNCRTIFAVGDVVDGRPELNPVAIKTGKLVVRRLFTSTIEHMDYQLIPTTIFTPLEYSSVGLSEERAVMEYGKENVVCFDAFFQPLEWKITNRNIQTPAYAKMVCKKTEEFKIVGFHFLGANAGEVMQGLALSMKLGAKKTDVDSFLAIHPTSAEIFTMLKVKTHTSEATMKVQKVEINDLSVPLPTTYHKF